MEDPWCPERSAHRKTKRRGDRQNPIAIASPRLEPCMPCTGCPCSEKGVWLSTQLVVIMLARGGILFGSPFRLCVQVSRPYTALVAALQCVLVSPVWSHDRSEPDELGQQQRGEQIRTQSQDRKSQQSELRVGTMLPIPTRAPHQVVGEKCWTDPCRVGTLTRAKVLIEHFHDAANISSLQGGGHRFSCTERDPCWRHFSAYNSRGFSPNMHLHCSHPPGIQSHRESNQRPLHLAPTVAHSSNSLQDHPLRARGCYHSC